MKAKINEKYKKNQANGNNRKVWVTILLKLDIR